MYAVQDMIAGGDIYATTTPDWNLYFIYPPIAAVLMVPLAVGPYVFWQLVWTFGLIWAQQSVLKRCGVPRGWKLALVGDRGGDRDGADPHHLGVRPGEHRADGTRGGRSAARPGPTRPAEDARRFVPAGTLIGLAAAIKLTPALFVIFAFAVGRRRTALVAIASFLGFTVLGAVFQWSQTLAFWSGLAGGQTRTAPPLYAGNQSLLGVFHRLGDDSSTLTTLVGLAFAGLVALLGTFVAAQWWADGQRVFAVALVGLCTCLASPLSWTHHYVWILPMGAAVLLGRGLPRWVRILAGAWVGWVSLCLPLAVLPYGYDNERSYTALQETVVNLGPVLGVVLIIGLAWRMVRSKRSTPVRVPS